ncbi:MAG: flagellar motor switch protein FliM [Verrucomicrobia bacterium]|nr:flagellar motor switch protein FliM [Verrucomicrobiota bacterium]MCF7707904.1 flagellar motor switch protein FliM [Verrucomicrobiota bacterium]
MDERDENLNRMETDPNLEGGPGWDASPGDAAAEEDAGVGFQDGNEAPQDDAEGTPGGSGSQEILSQEDVEALLAQVAEEESLTVVFRSRGQKQKQTQDTILPFDFRQPAFLAPAELRQMRLRHKEFAASLAARLSIYLRLEIGLRIAKLQTLSFQRFIDTIETPSHISLFRIEPLRGIGLIDLPPRLGLTIVDRLLGGTARAIEIDREMSEIETALLDQVIEIVLAEWCGLWGSEMPLRPAILGHESNARFLQTAAHDTVMLVLALEARQGECLEAMQIGLPYYMLEPLVREAESRMGTTETQQEEEEEEKLKWHPALESVNIPVTGEWRGFEMATREVVKLKEGDLLQLEPQSLNEVNIRLGKLLKFKGRLGTCAEKWAVEVSELVNDNDK